MSKTCETCSASESKYKCPACTSPYCSLNCYKTHKENKCKPIEKAIDNLDQDACAKQEYSCLTQDTVGLDKLSGLARDETVKELLKNRHLRDLLLKIDCADNAEVTMQKAMLEPIFVEFADACLKIVDPAKD